MPVLDTSASNAQTKQTEQPNGVPLWVFLFSYFPVFLVVFFWPPFDADRDTRPKEDPNHRKAKTKPRGVHEGYFWTLPSVCLFLG
jgi:hypothetical protein